MHEKNDDARATADSDSPACQIHQVHDGGFRHLLPCRVLLFLHELNSDDGVRARRRCVHVGRGHRAICRPLVHLGVDGAVAVHGRLSETLRCEDGEMEKDLQRFAETAESQVHDHAWMPQLYCALRWFELLCANCFS